MKNRNVYIATIGALILGTIIYFGYRNWPSFGSRPQYTASNAAPSDTSQAATLDRKPAAQIKAGKIYNGKTYQQLVDEYKGRRLQISDCIATPTSVTFKNGTTIMIDGFSADPQRITIGTQSVVLQGYDIAFMTLRSSTLPLTLTVDCYWLDQPQYNISVILLQA